MASDPSTLRRFHDVLVDELRRQRPERLHEPFTVAEIYQELVPYRSHRDRIGVEMNGDYEHLLLRLLAGEEELVELQSDAARDRLQDELRSPNPNTSLYRDFAAAEVRITSDRMEAANGEGVGSHERQEPGDDSAEDGDEGLAMLDLDSGDGGAPAPPPEPREVREVQELRDEAGDEASADDGPGVCVWCRGELPDRPNLNFCPFCGTDVRLVPCADCGEELEPEWRFCIACGSEAAAV
jgi:hypothetical protein